MANPDRRGALAIVGGIGIAAGTFAFAGCSKAGEENVKGADEGEEGKVTANEDLMREHGVLRRILIVYREISPKLAADPGALDAKVIAHAAMLFRQFGERYHEQLLEEQHIFPIVRKAGGEAAGLIDTLLAQHARGRMITDYILDRTRSGSIASGDDGALGKAMLAFTRMYEAHTAREDTIVFPSFKSAVGEKRYAELGDRFEDIERKEFGGDGFDMALDRIATIERTLGVSNLAAFTAAAPPGGRQLPG
jgi:hemerythrin-like domain-containing protein